MQAGTRRRRETRALGEAQGWLHKPRPERPARVCATLRRRLDVRLPPKALLPKVGDRLGTEQNARSDGATGAWCQYNRKGRPRRKGSVGWSGRRRRKGVGAGPCGNVRKPGALSTR